MCGIVGYIGPEEATSILLAGLRELEYRGYDSAGVAILQDDGLHCFKAVGKLDNLAARVGSFSSSGPVAAIGHTRWATHGKPTEINAHPHGLTHSQVVHNGIIENYRRLKDEVATPYLSQTDSEVIVHLFEKNLAAHNNNPARALQIFRATLNQLHGAYAILLISEQVPGQIFFARQGSPLQIGFAADGCRFASSDAPLLSFCDKAVYLEDGQWGMATIDRLQLFAADGKALEPVFKSLPPGVGAARKEGFRYFMEKEIYEQPAVLTDILTG
ncbi:MAG: glutamine--fructose-6-phosphate aminotransferase, partial [Haliea sp.]